MTEFIPESMKLLEPIQSTSGAAIVDDHTVREMQYEDVEKLLIARPADFPKLALTYCPNLLDKTNEFTGGLYDLLEIQRVMSDTVRMLHTACSGHPESAILSLASVSSDDIKRLCKDARQIVTGPSGPLAPPYLTRMAAIKGDALLATIRIPIDRLATGYTAFLANAAAKVPNWAVLPTPETEAQKSLTIENTEPAFFPNTKSGRAEAFKWAFDKIATLHMADIRTVSVNGGKEWRTSDTGLSMAWWLLIDRLRTGRTGVCEECGMPFITNNERGNPRRFCSKKCQMRAVRRKKGQTPPKGSLDSKGDAETRKEERKE